MYQDAAGKTECKVCDVVNVSHLSEYLVVTENHVTDDSALEKVATCCVCGTGTYDNDANSSTVYVDHRTCGAGNYTSAPGNNSVNPKCDHCEASTFKEAESPTPPFWKGARIVGRSSVRRARGVNNCTSFPAELHQNAVGSTNCKLLAAGMYQDAAE